MRNIVLVVAVLWSFALVSSAMSRITNRAMTPAEAVALYEATDTVEFNTPFSPTKNPGAQWYPNAGFGLFIHWGIYAQTPVNPSWSMLKNGFRKPGPAQLPKDEYYAQAETFNPQKYNPDNWMKMAKSMGMQYAVLTTKHHDGYCMWPSKYGKYTTGNYMGGRDLVKEYTDACRKNGLKVGLYFSPRDWAYNDHVSMFDHVARGFDWLQEPDWPFDGEETEREYDKWLAYTIGQLSELLTQYGEINVLWFDGVYWKGVKRPEDDRKVRNWIYKLQPQIVINPRWGGKPINPDYDKHDGHHSLSRISRNIGDFYTYESRWQDMEERNEGLYADIWFEYCTCWKGHWGHIPATSPEPDMESVRKVAYELTTISSFGGNYLLNIGPDRDGLNRPDIEAEAEILAQWMEHAKLALINVDPVKYWEGYSNVPLTQDGNRLFAHLPTYKGRFSLPIMISNVDRPLKAVLLHSGKKVSFNYDPSSRALELNLTDADLDPLGISTQIAFDFRTAPEFPEKDVKEAILRRAIPLLPGSPETLDQPAKTLRISLQGKQKTLHLAEIEAYTADGENIVLGATASSEAYGGTASRLIDGNTSPSFSAKGIYHSATETSPWCQVDLDEKVVQVIRIYNRGGGFSDRLIGAELELLDDSGERLWGVQIKSSLLEYEIHCGPGK